ncbi:unnamed protein product [Rotaria sp. Silwood2]|nr:unnamed protein product [Rotaria sp. Silwood2]CAF4550666.1 unnamed protein product [Rotaria sp. Silwood2]
MISIRVNNGLYLKHCSTLYSIIELSLSRIDDFHESMHDVSVNSFISIGSGFVGTSYGYLIVTDSLERL